MFNKNLITKGENQQINGDVLSIQASPLERLKHLTNQELERLSQQNHSMESIHSNLDLLIKRYNIEQSYIGTITNWYGSRPWWAKIILLLLAGIIGACIGMLCHIPIILAIVACVIYIFFAYFFTNHYNVTQKQTKMLCEDIIELEKALSETINHFNELSESLKNIFKSLHQMNHKMLENTQQLEKNISNLSRKILEYKHIIQQLSEAKSSLIGATTQMSTELKQASDHFSECYQIIIKKSDNICWLDEQTSLTDRNLAQYSNTIQTLAEKYHVATLQISNAAKNMENMYSLMQAQISTMPSVNTTIVIQKDISNELSPSILNNSDIVISQTSVDITNSHESNAEPESSLILEQARQARGESSSVRNKISLLLHNKKSNPYNRPIA